MCCSNSITFGTNLSLILHMLPHLLVCQIHHSPEPIGRASNSLEPFGKQHSVLSTQMQKATLSSFGQGVSGQDGGRLSAISLRGKCTLRRYFCNSPQCLRFSKKNLNLWDISLPRGCFSQMKSWTRKLTWSTLHDAVVWENKWNYLLWHCTR